MSHSVHGGCASGAADHARGNSGRWRIRELARVAATAAASLFVCSPLAFASRPKTPLRVFCIAAFEFLARLRGGALGKRRRRTMALACDFGSLCDDYYDHGRLDRSQYRSLRRELRWMAPEAATARYLRELREAERGRPVLSAGDPALANASIEYRTRVLDLSLRWMQAISGLSVEAAKFQVLLDLVGLMQMADDVLDWEDDRARGCPSYVTGLLPGWPNHGISLALRARADALLRRLLGAVRRDPGAVPFAMAGVLTWTLVVALLKARFPRSAPSAKLRRALQNLEVGARRPLLVRRESVQRIGAGKRILFASDLHLRGDGPRHIADELVEIAARECPDLILLGGDLADSRRGTEALESLVRRFAGVAPVGAVGGNHDRWFGLSRVRAAVLAGGGRWLEDTPWLFAPGCAVYGSEAQPAQPARRHLLCTHHPAGAPRRRFDLTLSGHLHGGQFVFYERRGRLYPGAFLYRWNGLRFESNEGETMLISRGVRDTLPLRWNCPREVLLVDI